jgi:hypothetical protein
MLLRYEESSMRHLVGIVAVCVGLQTIVSAQVPGTASELADDWLGGALWRIAVATQTRIGFESVEFLRTSGVFARIPAFPVSSRDEALRAAIGADSRYEWRAIGDFVVVRPKSAWTDASNPFNRPVRNLQVENGTSLGTLLGLRDFIYTNSFAVLPGQGPSVSFAVPSGTVVDALNRLMESSDAVLWFASYRPNAQPGQRYPSWGLQMELRNARGLDCATDSPLPRRPQ